MAKIETRKGSPYYHARFKDEHGKRVRKCTFIAIQRGNEGRSQAQDLANKWERDAFDIRMFGREPKHEPVIFDELTQDYLANVSVNKSANGRRDYDALKHLSPAFQGRDVTTITTAEIKTYMRTRQRTVSPSTVNKEVGLLRNIIRYGNEELGLKIGNPTKGCHLKEPEGIVRWITHEEADRLIEVAKSNKRAPWLADIITLSLYTGMRRGEVMNLPISHVDLKNNLIFLETGMVKTRNRRSVPLNEIARQAVLDRYRFRAEFCPDSPWLVCNWKGQQIKDAKRSFDRARKSAKIENFRWHDMRHTFASWAVMAGVPLIVVRDLLGHKSIESTEIYAHLAPDTLRAGTEEVVRNRYADHLEVKRFGS